MKRTLLTILVLLLALPGTARAAETDFASWLADLRREAASQGVPAETLNSALRDLQPNPHIVELDNRQPETTLTLEQYLAKVVQPARIEKGRQLKFQNKALLRAVSDRYGVPPKVIMALWAAESSFGDSMGTYRVVESLATLAFDGRRPDLFRAELIAALKILGRGDFSRDDLKGSWAGAMGQVQFMPSTYLHYAVNFEHSGQPDIWRNHGDVFASAANYLATLGWKRDETWGREVKLPARFSADMVGLPVQHTVSEWAAMGVRRLDGGKLPASTIHASVVAPDGMQGRTFLVYDNFRTLMKWNHSTYFGLSVNLLADGIGN
jgi:membrane-bound lytic murein transglycosylase B